MKRAITFVAQGFAVGALALLAGLLISYLIGVAIVLAWVVLLALVLHD